MLNPSSARRLLEHTNPTIFSNIESVRYLNTQQHENLQWHRHHHSQTMTMCSGYGSNQSTPESQSAKKRVRTFRTISELSGSRPANTAVDRKPIDPPPIVQLIVSIRKDPTRRFLTCPYYLCICRLVLAQPGNSPDEIRENDLVGTVVSSLYSLKDTDNSQGGFFVFPDLSCRREGTYRLEFSLYEIMPSERTCQLRARTDSDPFVVYPQKFFPGMSESTFLTRSFSDQGVRLRLRKDSRTVTTRKRNSQVANQVASQVDQIRQQVAAHQGQYATSHDGTDLGHQNGQGGGHHLRRGSSIHQHDPVVTSGNHMDQSRGSIGSQSQSSYFSGSPQMRSEYGSGSYGYSGFDDSRPGKRLRLDGGGGGGNGVDPTNGTHSYDNDYGYPSAGPRTVPDSIGTSMYPASSFPVLTQPAAMAGLPAVGMPGGGHGGMPGLPLPPDASHYGSMSRMTSGPGGPY